MRGWLPCVTRHTPPFEAHLLRRGVGVAWNDTRGTPNACNVTAKPNPLLREDFRGFRLQFQSHTTIRIYVDTPLLCSDIRWTELPSAMLVAAATHVAIYFPPPRLSLIGIGVLSLPSKTGDDC